MKNESGEHHLTNLIYWNLTSMCNLKCSFCNFHQSDAEKETQFVLGNMDRFYDQFGKLPETWEFFIGGGEPFVFPEFLNIVKSLAQMNHRISVATNFTASETHILKFIEAGHGHINNMVTSFKPDVHKYTKFLAKAKTIHKAVEKQGGLFSVGAVATKKDIDTLYEIGKQFQEHGIMFRLQVERVNGEYRQCTKAEEEKIRYFGRIYGLEGTARYKGRTCLAGIRYFMLTPSGDAFRCHSACTSPDAGGYLGNLIEGSFKLYDKPVKCQFECCNCVNGYNQKLMT